MPRRRRRAFGDATAVVMAVLCTAACAGGERGAGEDAPSERRAEVTAAEGAPRGRFSTADTLAPVNYQAFDEVVVSQKPKKVLVRLLALSPGERLALGKTVRVALDSIVARDADLAAARVILYTMRPAAQQEADLIPSVWGEWLPAAGWQAAGPRMPEELYRTYVFHADPGWPEPRQ